MSENTMPCPKCGQEIPQDALECPYCGVIPSKLRSPGDSPARGSAPSAPGGSAGSPASPPPASPSSTTALATASATTSTPRPSPPAEEAGLYDPDAPPAVAGRGGGGTYGSPPGASGTGGSHGPVTDIMVEHLSKTGPWAMLMGVLFFLTALLLVLAAIFGTGGASAAGMSPLFLFVYFAVAAIVYLVFALQLFSFGQAARQVGMGGGTQSMEEALGHQRRFWRLLGILALIWLGLMLLAVIPAFLAGVA